MLKRGSTILSIWSGINFLLAFFILSYVVVFNGNSPILQVVRLQKSEIASLDAKIIASLNCFDDPVQLLLAGYLGAGVVAHPEKPDRRPKMGLLDVAVRDRLCGSDGLYRLRTYRKRTLAGECCSERFIHCGHWFVWLFHIHSERPILSNNQEYSHESDYMHKIRAGLRFFSS